MSNAALCPLVLLPSLSLKNMHVTMYRKIHRHLTNTNTIMQNIRSTLSSTDTNADQADQCMFEYNPVRISNTQLH